MKTRLSFFSLFLFSILFSTAAMAGMPLANFEGKWINENSSTKHITKINLDVQSYSVKTRVWGKCHPSDCDWGFANGIPYGGTANVNQIRVLYVKSFKITKMQIIPLTSTRIKVISYTRFTDNSGRRPYSKVEYFKKYRRPRPAPVPIVEDCVSFNYNNLRIIRKYGKYLVVDGNHSVFSAPNRNEAEQIIKTARFYRLNRSCFVGRPGPSFTYLLRGGAAPSGPMPGEDAIGFNRNNIKVVPYGGGKYRILDGNHAMFLFPNKKEADLALRIIKKYGFNKSAFIGRPHPSLQYMRR